MLDVFDLKWNGLGQIDVVMSYQSISFFRISRGSFPNLFNVVCVKL